VSSLNIEDVCLFAVRKAQENGAQDAEAYAVSNKEAEVFIENNDLKQSKSDKTGAVGIRVFLNKALGFSSVNTFQRKYVEQAVVKAIKLAKISPADKFNSMPDTANISDSESSISNANSGRRLEGIYDKKAETVSPSQAINLAAEMLDSATSFDERVSVDSGNFASSVISHVLLNSNGVSAKEMITLFNWSIMGMAIDGPETSNFDFQFGGTHYVKGINVRSTAREFAHTVVNSLRPQKVDSFKGQALLNPSAINEIIQEVIAYSINSQIVQKESSQFGGKIGESVSSDLLTLEDDATNIDGLAASSFDREGIPHRRNVIIEKGILKTYIYNTYTSNKDDKYTTGNAGGSAKHPPSVSTTNMIVKAGVSEINELIKGITQGILINRFSGNVNPVNGDFSGVVKGGQYIKNGEIQYPVKELMMAGNVFAALKNIIGVSKETKIMSDAILPYIAFDNISFTAG
jgi:PmbA protein